MKCENCNKETNSDLFNFCLECMQKLAEAIIQEDIKLLKLSKK